MQKPVIVISSHVVRGSVGNRAAVFALEVLGHPVWAVPSLILPFHPGHGKGTRIVPDNSQFESLLDDLLNSPWIGEVSAILTGYMANQEQARAVGNFIEKARSKTPNLLHVCDPVMGDHAQNEATSASGKLYIAEETANAIKQYLCQRADILTPNRFELSYLSGIKVQDSQDAIDAAKALQVKTVLVTSMPGFMKGNIGNLLVEFDQEASTHKANFAEHRKLENPPNGPGDLTAALFLSHTITQDTSVSALQKTTASVFEIVAGAAKRGADELMLESDAQSITRAMTMVQMRSLTPAAPARKRTTYKPSPL